METHLAEGTAYRGVFYTATPFVGQDYKIAIKASRQLVCIFLLSFFVPVNLLCPLLKGESSAGSDAVEPGSTLIMDASAVQYIRVAKLDMQPKSDLVLTDSAIQRKNLSHLEGRDLQAASAWLDPTTLTSLDSMAVDPKWDQFAANKQLFNVESSFDESIYTSKLDMSKMSKEQIARAERLSREIERQTSTNVHLLEERGQLEESEYNEEDRFSGEAEHNSHPLLF